VPLKLKMPVTTLNRSDVAEVAAYARRLGAELRVDPLIIPAENGDLGPTRLRVPPADLLDLYTAPFSPYAPPAERLGTRGNRSVCGAGRRVACVGANGDLYACTILPVSAGSILERSFRDVWETSPWLQRLRAITPSDLVPCHACPRLAYCARCPAQALLEDGDLLGPSRWSCEHAGALERAFASRP
jgi:radical SAM protein with 4Fe4S-binding SPASM domain